MTEMFQIPLRDIAAFNGRGKFLGLLLVVLLFLFIFLREKKPFLIYGLIMALSVICPLTGVILWKYQTRFFDYINLLYLVPVVCVTAYGAVKASNLICLKTGKHYPFYILLIVLLFISANFGLEDITGSGKDETEFEKAEIIAEAIEEISDGERVLVWGPEFVMENVRLFSKNIYPIYGRDMFEESMKAYTYDSYGEDEIFLCEVMSAMEAKSAETVESEADTEHASDGKSLTSIETIEEAVDIAMGRGTLAILIPAGAEEASEVIEKRTGESGMEIEGHKLYFLE